MADFITAITMVGIMVAIAVPLVKALTKNTKATTELSEAVKYLGKRFEDYKVDCNDKFVDIKDDLETHEGYLVEHDKRIGKLEDYNKLKEREV